MNGYERRKEGKKLAIKKASFNLFQKQGPKDIKIEDIAKAAGVSQVTIYNHFGSKEALFREVIKDYTINQYKIHKALIEKDISFAEKMKAIILHKTNEVEHLHPNVIREAMVNDEELKQYFAAFQNQYSLPLLLELIKTAQKNEEVNPHLSERAILLYIQLFNNEILLSHISGEGGKELIPEIFQLFFYGLSMPEAD